MMSVSATTQQGGARTPQSKKYSATIRFWHWANSIAIMGSLITVLINFTLFEDEHVSDIAGGREIVHEFEEKIWEIHIYFGYVLAALFLFRIILELFQPSGKKLASKVRIAYLDYFVLRRNKDISGHVLIIKVSYFLFYLLLLIMTCSGLVMTFAARVDIPRNIVHSIKEFHGFCMYPILLFIIVHFFGVFRAERKDSHGIVSDMINGGKIY